MDRDYVNPNCNEARHLLKATVVLDEDGADGLDLHLQEHLTECSECIAWSRQMKEIETVTASMTQYDVPESLTQNILRAVDGELVPYKNAAPSLLLPGIFAVIMAAIFVIETHESVGGIISWAAGLAVMYSISLLVSSSQEAETA